MDDTIENLLDAWLDILNERYSRCVLPEDCTEWELHKAYPNLTREQVYAPLWSDALWQSVRPKWDAVAYLQKLQDDGHDVYITTSSNFQTIRTKLQSILERYFPFIPMDHVIVASRKQMIRGDVMVDDAPHNLFGGEYEKILMTAPHNRKYEAAFHGMRRADNWREIYALISEIAGKEE